jgi:hypothetical protein
MRCVAGLTARLVAAAVCVCLCDRVASADLMRRDDDTFLLFSGTDLWRHSSFSHGGLLWSPGGLDREGFTFKLLIGGGTYRYVSGALGDIDITGQQTVGFALPGWRFVRDRLIVTIFAGLDVQHHTLTPDDPGNNLWGTYAGIRGALEFWYEPDATTMWAGDASISSIGTSYAARLAAGWRLFDAFYAGPEIGGFASGNSYRQWRAGLHVTGFRTHAIEWSFGAGFASDSDKRDGVYGRLGLFTRR